MHVRVKICGITTAEDGVAAARLGADAVGLVFYPPSPRAVTAEQAATIVTALPPFVTVVGLFVNATADRVEAILDRVKIDLLQFHGDEDAGYCNHFSRPWIKAIRMRPGVDLPRQVERYSDAQALLVDAWQPGVPGGTGERFDWERLPSTLDKPLILAGGLNPENVRRGVLQVRPWAVDVSGGVEQEKGVKSHEQVARFIENAHSVRYE